MKKLNAKKPYICSGTVSQEDSQFSENLEPMVSDINMIRTFSFVSKSYERLPKVRPEYFLRSNKYLQDPDDVLEV